MLELMESNPQLQQMMLSALPPHMRQPDILKQMLALPQVREKIQEALLKQEELLPPDMRAELPMSFDAALSESARLGLDPASIFHKMTSNPQLADKMRDPRIMKAVMQLTHDPSTHELYKNDTDVLKTFKAMQDIMGQELKKVRSKKAPSGTTPPGETVEAAPAAAPGQGGEAEPLSFVPHPSVMAALVDRPQLVARLTNPRVSKALQEVAVSPWKVVKYLLDKEVMAAIKELQAIIRADMKKDGHKMPP